MTVCVCVCVCVCVSPRFFLRFLMIFVVAVAAVVFVTSHLLFTVS